MIILSLESRVPDDLTRDVIAIIAREQRLPVESISPEATFEQLKIDSLDGVNIVFALEEKYNLTIPDDVAREMKSVRQVVDALRTQLGAASPA
jgi:acyl carrier protein